MIGSIGCAFKQMLRSRMVVQLGLVLAMAVTPAMAQTTTPGTSPLLFGDAQVGVATGSALTLTETFTLTGYSTALAPTASMHYGLSYKAGTVACTGSAGNQTCTVSVTFLPTLPGGHRDAIFLMNGTSRLATTLVYGIGVSPLALVQPGIVTMSADQGTYLYTSVVADDGTVYLAAEEGSQIFARSTTGVIAALPITGLNSPRTIAIDGAGILYIADQNTNGPLTTYDTVLGVQGSIPFPTPNPEDIQTATVDNTGTVYMADYSHIYIFAPGAAQATVAINPGIDQASNLAVDSKNNLFIGGGSVNELTPGGTQTQVNNSFPVGGFGLDAADTLYLTGAGRGVEEFPASAYTTSVGTVDAADSALGVSVGPDGTAYVGNYSILDVVDRSQGKIDFGLQSAGNAAAPQTVQLYNGGNANLTISKIALSGSSTFSTTNPTNPCSASQVLAPGALCNLTIGFISQVPGSFTGALSFTTNSLNATSTQTVALSAAISGAYMVPSPAALDFGSEADGSTTATKTITLTNNGYAVAAQVYSPASTDPAFTVTLGTCNVNIAVGDSCALNVTFSPTAAQSYSATGSAGVTNAGPGGAPPVSFTLAGTGTAVAQITASPTSLNMGSETEYTENYTPQYVTLTNNSSSTVTFSNFQSSDPTEFDSQAYTCSDGGVLLGGQSCEISVRFSPLQVGVITANITMPYTGAGGGTLVVSLTGTGTVGTPAIALYPTPINFGMTPLGTTVSSTPVQVESVGTAPLTGITVSISGANAGDYTETNTCAGVTIQPYPGTGSCTVTVSLTPTGAGPRVAALNVTSNGGTVTYSTPLQGAGVGQPAQLQFTPAQLNLIAGVGGDCADAAAGGKASSATLCNITGAAQDYLGNTYLVDNTYNVVYKIDTTGALSVFAGTPSKTVGYAGDGGPATSAVFSGPTAVAADAFGDIFISDTGNGAIRVVDPTGAINSFVDSGCADTGHGTPQHGDAIASAGRGHRHDTQLCTPLKPEGLIVDSSGFLIFADALNNVVLESNITTGAFDTVAGDTANQYNYQGTAGYNGDNFAAKGAQLNAPQDVAVDAAGNIYIADTLNNRIRRVDASTRIITTVAGNGSQGDAGDGAAATDAEITPYGISANLAGDLFITPGAGGIVRKVDATGNINVFAGGGTGAIGGPAATGAVANAYFARVDNSGDLLLPTGLQVLAAGPDGLLQFGSQAVGTDSADLSVTLENTGHAILHLGTVVGTVTGTNAADFKLTGGNCGYTLASGSACTAQITFNPAASGARTASLSIPTDAAASPQIVLLQGNGTAASAPTVTLTKSVDFGTQPEGTTSAAQSITLSNTGTATLNISGITLTGTQPTYFAISSNGCGATLAAGASCTIKVTFTPTDTIAYAATLSVADDASGSPQTTALTGTGGYVEPQVTLLPATVNFGNVVQGTSSAVQTITLSNVGTSTYKMTSYGLGDTVNFGLTTTCTSTLAPGKSCTFSVTFTPSVLGALTTNLDVGDYGDGLDEAATLNGTGITAAVPAASLSPTTLVFPGTTSGVTSAALTTTLSNTGGAALTITGITLTGANAADFAITTTGTTCGATLAAGATCTISATFTPAVVGSFTASIAVADNAAGSPQTATLTGTGLTPPATDFTLTVTPPAQTVAAGGGTAYTVNTAGIGGAFDNAITLSVTGLPSGAAASFSPASVTPGANGANSVLSIQTLSPLAMAHPRPLYRGPHAPWLAALLVIPLLGLRRRLRNLRVLSVLLLLAATLTPMMLLAGCGGGYFAEQTQTYTVTVTGTSGSIHHSTTVTLTVQQ